MTNGTDIVASTRCWVRNVVIGHNFCPFARKPFEAGEVLVSVSEARTLEDALHDLIAECQRLDAEEAIETTLLVFANAFERFDDFLDLIELGEQLLAMQGYEGVYQLAHFHPDYLFEGADEDDPANYTNRSPWPTLHIIREANLERAVASHPDPESIPKRNVEYARKMGLAVFERHLEQCRQSGRAGE